MKLKKGIKRGLGILLIVLIIILAFAIFTNKFNKEKEVEEIKIINEITDFDYKLKENATDNYKKLFDELKSVLISEDVQEEEYVKIIAQMFIIDFYTLTNKISQTDIGGISFVHNSIKDNFQLKAMDTMYKYVESNLYGDRNQILPEVNEVVIGEVNVVSFEYNSTIDKNAFEVNATWNYKNDLGYDTKARMIFVHEEDKLSLVEIV